MNNSKLLLHSNGHTSYIDITPALKTLNDARQIILQEFDADQLPPSTNFAFRVDGVRISHAQEAKNLIADIVGRGDKVELIPVGGGVNNVTPSSVSEGNARNVDGSVNAEGYACMDSNRSTVSGRSLFQPIHGESAFGRPIKRVLQVHSICEGESPGATATDESTVPKKRTPIGKNAGTLQILKRRKEKTLPQKRTPIGKNADTLQILKRRKEKDDFSESQDDSTGGGKVNVKVEYDSESEMYVENPDQKSDSLTSDRSGSAADGSVDKLELKRTVEVFNLTASDDEETNSAFSASTNKDFTMMNGAERTAYWSDNDNLTKFFEKTLTNLSGAECEVCAETGVDMRCTSCGQFYHSVCVDESCYEVCLGCQVGNPQCHLCNKKGGIVVRTYARPGSMKRWKGKEVEYDKSLFGDDNFCHLICGMFNPLTNIMASSKHSDHSIINCSQLIMSDGHSHVLQNLHCELCGMTNGTKVKCHGCNLAFHVTCARQAGLEVADGEPLKCFCHVRCQFVLRARLEDMMWAEKQRWSKESFKPDAPMHWNHAASLLHFAIDILRTIGWAWRWAEWWVEHGDNWEPYLDEGETELGMTDEELKRVRSTAASRDLDARSCQLEQFGAALRNRAYDEGPGGNVYRVALERALARVLITPSLVGPLDEKEIAFYKTWLSLAYQSRSPKLGFGADKIPANSEFFTRNDGSAKCVLGHHPLPGKHWPAPRGRRRNPQDSEVFV